jgi:hypothetical protein
MRFSKEMAEQLYMAITGGALDCELRHCWYNGEYRYEIQWVFKDIDNKGRIRYWQFTILIPEQRPEEFEVKGCNSNPHYTNNTSLQRSRKEEVRQRAYKELYRILEQSDEWQNEQQRLYDEYVELHGG